MARAVARVRGPAACHALLSGLGRGARSPAPARPRGPRRPGHRRQHGSARGQGAQQVPGGLAGLQSVGRRPAGRRRSSRRDAPGSFPMPRWPPTRPRIRTAPIRPPRSASRLSSRCSPTIPGCRRPRRQWAFLETWEKPFLTVFGDRDAVAFAAGAQGRCSDGSRGPTDDPTGSSRARITSSRRTPPTSWWPSSTGSPPRSPRPTGPDGTIGPDPDQAGPKTRGSNMATVATVRGPVDAADLGPDLHARAHLRADRRGPAELPRRVGGRGRPGGGRRGQAPRPGRQRGPDHRGPHGHRPRPVHPPHPAGGGAGPGSQRGGGDGVLHVPRRPVLLPLPHPRGGDAARAGRSPSRWCRCSSATSPRASPAPASGRACSSAPSTRRG